MSGRRRGNPKWAQAYNYPMAPPAPSAWELQLRALNLSEREALSMMEARSRHPAAVALRQWIEREARRSFIPDDCLRACGVYSEPNLW
jgi:hypothetical protein